MNSTNLINFQEEDNNIPYFGGYQEIGDFHLEKNTEDKKIIEDAKVGFTVYGVKNIEELKNTTKKITIVIPALTGTSKIFDTAGSQGNGWANTYGKPGNILDPNENIIIGLDYFGSAFNNSKDKHSLNFYPVPPEKQVEAWKKALKKLGVKNIDILFGGSNGGGHIHNWLLDKNKDYEPKILIPVAGPVAPTKEAKEFFSIQLDFIKNKGNSEVDLKISDRLNKNLEKLKGKSYLYDELIEETTKEINETLINWDDKKAIKIVRQIGFLKFVGPKFFDKFNFEKSTENKKGKKLNENKAIKNMMNYFKNEGKKFEERFGLSYLKTLLEGIVDAERISPEKYVKNISKKVKLIIISIEDDTLFESKPMKQYFYEVKKLRELRGDTGETIFKILDSSFETIISSHDAFLQVLSGQLISDMILDEF